MPRPAGHRLSPDAWTDVLTLAGLNLTQAAERCGVPRATLSSLVGGNHRASVPVAKQIADGLGVSARTLLPSLADRAA